MYIECVVQNVLNPPMVLFMPQLFVELHHSFNDNFFFQLHINNTNFVFVLGKMTEMINPSRLVLDLVSYTIFFAQLKKCVIREEISTSNSSSSTPKKSVKSASK